MSEYIVKLPMSGAADEFVAKHGVDDCRLYGYKLTGEIVRCRDCRHFTSAEGLCMRLFNAMAVEPHGFCAWGSRRGYAGNGSDEGSEE